MHMLVILINFMYLRICWSFQANDKFK